MIVAAAVVPGSPLLVPVAGAAPPDDGVAGLRRAAADAVAGLVEAGPSSWLVLGPGPRSQVHSPVAAGSLRPWGLDLTVHLGNPACGATDPLPLSLTLGAWLLREAAGPRTDAVGVSCADDVETSPAAAELLGRAAAPRVALLVVADGAERFPPLDGPGHTAGDIAAARAAADAQDDVLATALARGDGDALADLPAPDPRVALRSWSTWRAAGRLLAGGGVAATLRHRAVGHGVGWLVASWALPDPDRA